MTTSTDSGSNLTLAKRSAVLFVNFLLIILAYYQIKPARNSLFLEFAGADNLPYAWIATALVWIAGIGFYHRMVARHSRQNIVLGTCLCFMALLIVFRVLLGEGSALAAAAFYVLVDVFSVVLVEQFWSLTNTIYTTEEGKRWYGIVGTGGLVGGVVGALAGGKLLEAQILATADLLLVAAAILAVIFAFNLAMVRIGMFREAPTPTPPIVAADDWRSLIANRYLLLIGLMLLLAQLAAAVVDFQFNKTVAIAYTELDERTAFFSRFFAILGLVSIGVNVVLTPVIHRYLGVIAGLMIQPVVLLASSVGFMLQTTLFTGGAMKISDRGLSYSINRASKELLYVPVDPVHTYQAKAWIDMFGYRLFKVVGSVLVLALTQWLPLGIGIVELGWFTVVICIAWIAAASAIGREYAVVTSQPLSPELAIQNAG